MMTMNNFFSLYTKTIKTNKLPSKKIITIEFTKCFTQVVVHRISERSIVNCIKRKWKLTYLLYLKLKIV